MPHPDIQALIIDMDGVLWKDSQAIGDLPSIFGEFSRRNYKITLATNNATRTIPEYLEKLARFGVHLSAEQIVNSSQAVSHYLKEHFPAGGNVYVVGEESLVRTLVQAGFNTGKDDILAVIASLDRHFNYEKLKHASMLVRSGIPLLATNPDKTFPTPNGLVPGAGAVVAAIEAASETTATIIGKPSPEMYRVAMQRMQVHPHNTLVIGDRLETDIIGGQQLGCQTALVLSGVTSPARARSWVPAPDWIAPDLTGLLATISRDTRDGK